MLFDDIMNESNRPGYASGCRAHRDRTSMDTKHKIVWPAKQRTHCLNNLWITLTPIATTTVSPQRWQAHGAERTTTVKPVHSMALKERQINRRQQSHTASNNVKDKQPIHSSRSKWNEQISCDFPLQIYFTMFIPLNCDLTFKCNNVTLLSKG